MSHRATLSDLIDALTQNMTTVDIAQTALHIELSQKIRKARKKLGMSQKDLAEKMGVKQSLVSRWESSECNYTIDTLVEIADALGLSVRCPLTFNESVPPGVKWNFLLCRFRIPHDLMSMWRADRFLNRITKGVLPDGCSSAQCRYSV